MINILEKILTWALIFCRLSTRQIYFNHEPQNTDRKPGWPTRPTVSAERAAVSSCWTFTSAWTSSRHELCRSCAAPGHVAQSHHTVVAGGNLPVQTLSRWSSLAKVVRPQLIVTDRSAAGVPLPQGAAPQQAVGRARSHAWRFARPLARAVRYCAQFDQPLRPIGAGSARTPVMQLQAPQGSPRHIPLVIINLRVRFAESAHPSLPPALSVWHWRKTG
jgi:hypothetical protein